MRRRSHETTGPRSHETTKEKDIYIVFVLSCFRGLMFFGVAPFVVQNKNFTANCICRADPESPVGKRVLLITPNDVLPTVATRPG